MISWKKNLRNWSILRAGQCRHQSSESLRVYEYWESLKTGKTVVAKQRTSFTCLVNLSILYIYINIIANIDTIWYISILSYTAVNFWFLSASMSRYVGHETPPCSVFSTRLMSAEHSDVQIVRQQLVPLHYLPWPTSSQFFAGQIQDSEIMKLNSWTVEHPKNWIEKVFCSIFFYYINYETIPCQFGLRYDHPSLQEKGMG